ncbi:MAG: M23 family metallopeptidase [Candidatus Viridilinea halotolerans]|uniref:M23 family metallopeptidase n=1 Tax=Candidatus Viridilinea halotolerans TaxID=2491704 RepID=A0A426TTD3_9CHLR|nr:MAG: M23 family metallopeptidase [Candidatus Viridilinea halotolerans]
MILILVLVSLGLLGLLASTRDDEVRISRWRGPASGAVLATDAGGLSGVTVAQTGLSGRGLPGTERPHGNPLRSPQTVMTQGYGVGTHAPAAVWGAIDLAIDITGDGRADPEGSWNHPIYATHYGVVKVSPNSYPAGNHIWVTNDLYRTGYAHLADFAVITGQTVAAGDLLGYMGSTGMSSGPHLDYQIWVNQNGTWANANPLDFGTLEGSP